MNDEQCRTCRFWRAASYKLGDDTSTGDCRRKPPRIVDEIVRRDDLVDNEVDHPTIYLATRYPLLAADDWCGKWDEHPHLIKARVDAQEAEEKAKRHARYEPRRPTFDSDLDYDVAF